MLNSVTIWILTARVPLSGVKSRHDYPNLRAIRGGCPPLVIREADLYIIVLRLTQTTDCQGVRLDWFGVADIT